jgi:hypothetical protein
LNASSTSRSQKIQPRWPHVSVMRENARAEHSSCASPKSTVAEILRQRIREPLLPKPAPCVDSCAPHCMRGVPGARSEGCFRATSQGVSAMASGACGPRPRGLHRRRAMANFSPAACMPAYLPAFLYRPR